VTFSIEQPVVTKDLVNVGVSAVFSMISLKIMMSDLQRPDISNTSIEPAVVRNNQKFDDFHGGEKIKAKFKEIIDFLQHPRKY
jgi:ATP-dependent Zn protease